MRKSKELSTFGRVLAKLMAIRDTFEWRELSEKLKTELGYEISSGAISNYARDRRQPPRHFFNAVRKVLRLNDEMWWLLLTSYYKPEELTVEAMARQDRKFLEWLVESELLSTGHRLPAVRHGAIAAEEQNIYEHEAQNEGQRGDSGDLTAGSA